MAIPKNWDAQGGILGSASPGCSSAQDIPRLSHTFHMDTIPVFQQLPQNLQWEALKPPRSNSRGIIPELFLNLGEQNLGLSLIFFFFSPSFPHEEPIQKTPGTNTGVFGHKKSVKTQFLGQGMFIFWGFGEQLQTALSGNGTKLLKSESNEIPINKIRTKQMGWDPSSREESPLD